MIGLQELEKTTNATVISKGASNRFENIFIDSRKVTPGSIFFAIKGNRFDGHDFIDEAVKNGAVAVVCQKDIKPIEGVSLLKVDDSIKALGMLARFNRLKYSIPVIAVTGSVGKTTTKELIAKNLIRYGDTVYTEDNQNNHIGVPLTLLKINRFTKYAVIEIGSNHPGEISYLASLVKPTHSLITSVGASHLEAFETIENVIAEKLSVMDETDSKGYLIIDASDDLLVSNAMEKAREIDFDKKRIIRFYADSSDKAKGDIVMSNSAAAKAVFSLIEPGKTFKPVSIELNLRMERRFLNGASIVLDCYNANPISFRYAIEQLNLEDAKRRFVVIGDMAELGKNSIKYHIQIVNMLRQSGFRMVSYGKMSKAALDRCGISAPCFDNPKDAANYLFGELKTGDQLLIKGSRAMQMENIWYELLRLASGRQLELPVS